MNSEVLDWTTRQLFSHQMVLFSNYNFTAIYTYVFNTVIPSFISLCVIKIIQEGFFSVLHS